MYEDGRGRFLFLIKGKDNDNVFFEMKKRGGTEEFFLRKESFPFVCNSGLLFEKIFWKEKIISCFVFEKKIF